MSINSGSPAGSQDKHQSGGQTSALYTLGVKVNKINETFASALLLRTRLASTVTTLHNAEQRLEKGLTNKQKVALMDLFEMSMVVADMFLSLDEDDGSL